MPAVRGGHRGELGGRVQMLKYAIGQSVPRTEDPRLLRGYGRYVDDNNMINQA